MGKPLFERAAIIGLGLIGSSLCHVMQREGLAGHIAGHARSPQTRKTATDLGFLDSVHETPAEAVENADLVIICTPVGAYGTIGAAIAPVLRAGAIVTDVGSVKSSVIEDLTPHMPEGVHFIPGHPIAGTEHSGPEAGFAELFEDRWCILTPLPETDPTALKRLKEFWRACGSNIDVMDAAHHDRVLSVTSHLPQLIAWNIVITAADLEEVTQSEVIKYSAAGFRDFTRLAASDPTMWRDIYLNNREAVLELLGRFSEDLSVLQRAIRWGDGDLLFKSFSRSRDIRERIIAAGQDVAVPNFGRYGAQEPSSE